MLKITTYVINEGTKSQYFGLMTTEKQVLYTAPNNWKTRKGAENWARKHGYLTSLKNPQKTTLRHIFHAVSELHRCKKG